MALYAAMREKPSYLIECESHLDHDFLCVTRNFVEVVEKNCGRIPPNGNSFEVVGILNDNGLRPAATTTPTDPTRSIGLKASKRTRRKERMHFPRDIVRERRKGGWARPGN